MAHITLIQRFPVLNIGAISLLSEIRRGIKLLSAIDQVPPSEILMRTGKINLQRLVTVVVPMFNVREYIEICLKGLLLQSYKNMEIFCVDDHSSDDTYEKVIDLFGSDKRICAIRLAENVGPFQIKNWIISRLASGKFIAMQDADDVSHPARISLQIKQMKDINVKICGTQVHHFFPPHIRPIFGVSQSIKNNDNHYEHSLGIYNSVESVNVPLSFEDALGRIKSDYVCKHGSQIFQRDLLIKFGGFDGRTKFGADTDMNWRLLRYTNILNLRQVLYFRRFHENSLTRNRETGLTSNKRKEYVSRRDAEHENIRAAMEIGNNELMLKLCTRDFYCNDVKPERVHTNFDIQL